MKKDKNELELKLAKRKAELAKQFVAVEPRILPAGMKEKAKDRRALVMGFPDENNVDNNSTPNSTDEPITVFKRSQEPVTRSYTEYKNELKRNKKMGKKSTELKAQEMNAPDEKQKELPQMPVQAITQETESSDLETFYHDMKGANEPITEEKVETPIADIVPEQVAEIAKEHVAPANEQAIIIPLPNLPQANKSVLERLEEARIDSTATFENPPVSIEILGKDGEFISVGTQGSSSLVTGKPKSRKSFLVGCVIASLLQAGLVLNRIKGTLPANQKKILYFDTEQSKHFVHRAVNRILRLMGVQQSDNLITYGLRSYTPAQRLEMIETAIYNTPGVGFVAIDGIRDCVTSINVETEANMIANKLEKWTSEKNIHIMCVLHQNKSDNNSRGVLGTELNNKSESVISVTKDKSKEVSHVEAVFCRDKDFEKFSFRINEQELPEIVESEEGLEDTEETDTTPEGCGSEFHEALLTQLFADGKNYKKHLDVRRAIKPILEQKGFPSGINKATDFMQYYAENKMIVKDKDKKKYVRGEGVD